MEVYIYNLNEKYKLLREIFENKNSLQKNSTILDVCLVTTFS